MTVVGWGDGCDASEGTSPQRRLGLASSYGEVDPSIRWGDVVDWGDGLVVTLVVTVVIGLTVFFSLGLGVRWLHWGG